MGKGERNNILARFKEGKGSTKDILTTKYGKIKQTTILGKRRIRHKGKEIIEVFTKANHKTTFQARN